MPIYSFKCEDCGSAKDHLLKLSETIASCPSCNSANYKKQLTSASFSMGQSESKAACGASVTEIKEMGCGGACACHPK